MSTLIATIAVRTRSIAARITRRGDTSGLTTRCRGCDDPSVHDAHLAPGALAYLTR